MANTLTTPMCSRRCLKPLIYSTKTKSRITFIATGLTNTLIACVPGKPLLARPDESELWAGLSDLLLAEEQIKHRIRRYERTLARLERERGSQS